MEKRTTLPPFGTLGRPHDWNVNHEIQVQWGKRPNGLFVRVIHTLPTLIKGEPRRHGQIQLLHEQGLTDQIISDVEGWGENENRYLDKNGSIT